MNYKDFSIGLLGGLVVVLGILLFQSQGLSLGAQSNFSGPLNSLAGYQESGTEVVDTDGRWVGDVSSTQNINIGGLQIDGLSTFTEIDCVAFGWDPPNITSSTPSSTQITATGLGRTDAVIATFGTSTQGLGHFVSVTSTGDIAMFTLFMPAATPDAGINLVEASGTICWFDSDD